MEELADIKKTPAKTLAAELLALNPHLTIQKVASKVGVSERTVHLWKQDPNFVEAIYDRYMLEFGSEIPSVLNAMVREAKEGNVQAGRLVLEHSGKLVKNINVTIDSPFEKFLKGAQVAEVVSDEDIIDVASEVVTEDDSLPERNTEDQGKRAVREKKITIKEIKKEEQRTKYNAKQKEWYRWRKRAKKAGIPPLKSRRPTPAQRKEWQRSIVQAESSQD
jgi:predicted nucleic acid-binding protein